MAEFHFFAIDTSLKMFFFFKCPCNISQLKETRRQCEFQFFIEMNEDLFVKRDFLSTDKLTIGHNLKIFTFKSSFSFL